MFLDSRFRGNDISAVLDSRFRGNDRSCQRRLAARFRGNDGDSISGFPFPIVVKDILSDNDNKREL